MRILAITGKTLLILMACMSFMGCASFSRHNLPEVGEDSATVAGGEEANRNGRLFVRNGSFREASPS